jgi:hypothetical protein
MQDISHGGCDSDFSGFLKRFALIIAIGTVRDVKVRKDDPRLQKVL